MTNISLADLGWSAHFMMQASELNEDGTLVPARLSQVHRNRIDALCPEGTIAVTTQSQESTGGYAVGDWVLVNAEAQIEYRLDRLNELKRRAAGLEAKAQLIGANIDVLFITTSCNKDFNPARLERYLILARAAEIQPVVLLTKSDLVDDVSSFEGKTQKLDPLLPVIFLDARNKAEADTLFDWWRPGQTAALLGSSGVGKTTLLNTLGGIEEDTGGIREGDAKGRHTTTSRGLYGIGETSAERRWVIDTPGMRELGLFDVSEGVQAVFADIISLAEQCRFSDCQHGEEPDCAVLNAIESGDLDLDRFKRWQKLEREDAHNNRTVAEARHRNRQFARTVRKTLAQKRELNGKK